MSETKRQLASIAELAHLVNASSDLGSMLDRICFGICRYTHWNMCSIMSVDEEAAQSVLVARFDPFLVDDVNAPRKWELQSSPARSVITTGEPVILLDAQVDDNFPHYRADARTRKYHTVVILLLPARDMYARKMVIAVQSKAVVDVDEENLEFLRTVSHLAAIAVSKAHRLLEEQQFNERIQKASDAAGKLMKLVLSDSAAAPVVRAIEALMGCPVIILDHSAHAIFVGRPPNETLQAEAWFAAVDRHFHDQIRHRGTVKPTTDAISVPGLPSPIETQSRVLTVDGEQVGAIHFVQRKTTIAQIEDFLIQNVCFAASVLLMRSVVTFKSESESQAKILQELISGDADREDFRARAMKAGFDLQTGALLLLISPCRDFQRPDSLLEFHRAASSSLRTAFHGAICVIHEANSLLGWVPGAESGADARKPLAEVSKELTRIFGASPLIAMSDICFSGAEYAKAWQSCERTLKLASRFNRSGVINEMEFGAHALVLASMPEKDIAVFVKRTLGPLERADAQGSADLLLTVETFLRSGCKLQRCADKLSIHVTTLRYRLERARDLCKLDFEDEETRFALELAFRFRQAQLESLN